MGLILKSIKNIKIIENELDYKIINSFNYVFIDEAIETIKKIKVNYKNKNSKIKYRTILENYSKNNNRCICSLCGIEANLAKVFKTKYKNKIVRLYHYNNKNNIATLFNIDHINPRSNGGRA